MSVRAESDKPLDRTKLSEWGDRAAEGSGFDRIDIMIDVNFQHFRCVIPDEALVKYGSPHFVDSEAGKALRPVFENKAASECKIRLSFEPDQVLCSNEAFPEAAVADPLADLELWDEWESGVRVFPYPGKYPCLEIINQPGKTSSTSSVGVLGEIFSGLFAQAGVFPSILVRVIRRWPDFILLTGAENYAFLESKAFAKDSLGDKPFGGCIPDSLLKEFLVNSVRQLNADASVGVWGSFTHLLTIRPMKIQVTFVELLATQRRQELQILKEPPAPVLRTVAERAVGKALDQLSPEWLQRKQSRQKLDRQRQGKLAENWPIDEELLSLSKTELDSALAEIYATESPTAPRDVFVAEITRLLRENPLERVGETAGGHFREAKAQASRGLLSKVRSISGRAIYMADLASEARSTLERFWKRSWESANRPWSQFKGQSLWRCGWVVFAIDGRTLEGVNLTEVNQHLTP